MKNTEINIPEIKIKKDFIIVYKGPVKQDSQLIEQIIEIPTSKSELLRKLRYFERKSTEIKQMSEIFIHDKYCPKIFSEFIDSIVTGKLQVNEHNYIQFLELSTKYEYEELEEEMKNFSEKRPDIEEIIENQDINGINENIEDKLSKNLDICLRNEFFIQFPIPTLNRILNSPSRNLKDHHLLYEFVKKIIKKYEKSSESDDFENLQVLVNCLDYRRMSNEEIDEFLNNDEFLKIFNYCHINERMKVFIDENKMNKKKISELETQICNLNKKQDETNQRIQSNEKQSNIKFDTIMKKLSEHEQIIANYQQENEKLQNLINNQKTKLNDCSEKIEMQRGIIANYKLEHEQIIANYQQEDKKLQNLINNQKTKLNGVSEKIEEQKGIIANYQLEHEKFQKLFKGQEKIISALELNGQITATVDQDQEINGTIKISNKINKIDENRSKYIINTNSSPELGENEYKNGNKIENLTQNLKFGLKAGTYFIHAIVFDVYGNSKELISQGISTKGYQKIFKYTGKAQSIVLGPGTYKLEVWGAEGGENTGVINSGCYKGNAGKGGYSVGILKLTKETKLYVYVGESPKSSKGGWNGGGSAPSSAAGGGGGTDISLYGEEGSSDWNNANHLYSRIIVAGGGGGSSHSQYPQWRGGCGGGLEGGNSGDSDAKGGKQKNGFSFGFGGDNNNNNNHNSAGGGGWYGGYTYNGIGWGDGGGGGSGFVFNSSTASNYPKGCKLNNSFYLMNSSTAAGTEMNPTVNGDEKEKGHSGNGYAKISIQ